MTDDDEVDPLGWHVIAGTHLLDLLRACAAGADPDMVMVELWANGEHEPAP